MKLYKNKLIENQIKILVILLCLIMFLAVFFKPILLRVGKVEIVGIVFGVWHDNVSDG